MNSGCDGDQRSDNSASHKQIPIGLVDLYEQNSVNRQPQRLAVQGTDPLKRETLGKYAFSGFHASVGVPQACQRTENYDTSSMSLVLALQYLQTRTTTLGAMWLLQHAKQQKNRNGNKKKSKHHHLGDRIFNATYTNIGK